jgi:stalled ribosome rescue protein Dom34
MVTTVHSNAESQSRRASDLESGPFEPLQVQSDDVRQRKYTSELNQYYDRVIEQIGDADSLIIFGPGEAKVELRHRLDKHRLSGVHISVETTDRMTEAQMLEFVRLS